MPPAFVVELAEGFAEKPPPTPEVSGGFSFLAVDRVR